LNGTLTAYLSKVLDQKPEDIKIYVHESLLGGGFGGKQDYDEILAAAYCRSRPESRRSQLVSRERRPTTNLRPVARGGKK
jgi:hypothetical protein